MDFICLVHFNVLIFGIITCLGFQLTVTIVAALRVREFLCLDSRRLNSPKEPFSAHIVGLIKRRAPLGSQEASILIPSPNFPINLTYLSDPNSDAKRILP